MSFRPRPATFSVSVVLVRPREEGNVGASARAMANMGLGELLLVEPAPELGGTARGFGVGGWHVLEAARRLPSLEAALAPFDYAVGTCSRRRRPLRGRRATRQLVSARELPAALRSSSPAAHRVALVFGPEDNGLTGAELELCDLVAHVPCAAEHPTLNLAQAVLLVAYELRSASALSGQERREDEEDPATSPPPLASPAATLGEREVLLERASPLLERLGFDHPHLHGSMVDDLRQLLRRAAPDRRQVGVLRRVLERLHGVLGNPEVGG